MTETNSNDKTRPTHTIYKVLGDGETAKWIKVGVAFPHKDQKGLALVFDGIPVEGRIAIRANRKQEEAAKPEPDAANQPELAMG